MAYEDQNNVSWHLGKKFHITKTIFLNNENENPWILWFGVQDVVELYMASDSRSIDVLFGKSICICMMWIEP